MATTKEVPVVERETRELQIPVPYGHLAAREWLPASSEDPSRRLLLLHGYQDNAASFYDLVPRLDPRWHAVAIDFTGHGLSSHLPLGAPYVSSLFSLDVARTVAHLGWDRFCIVGHSMGAHCGFNYGALFPDKVGDAIVVGLPRLPLGKCHSYRSRHGARCVFEGTVLVTPWTRAPTLVL